MWKRRHQKEEFLMITELEATIKGDDIFLMVDSFFKLHGSKWVNMRFPHHVRTNF